jgi:hypothetical protein
MRTGHYKVRERHKAQAGDLVAGIFVGAVLSILLGTAGTAWPQSTAPTQAAPRGQMQGQVQGQAQEQGQAQGSPAPPQSEPGPSAPDENSGLFSEMGKLFRKLPSLPPLKSPGETVDDLNNRAKEAGDTLSRLAKPSAMVSGREACPLSANGAPDCKQAADKLCQSKGYKEGNSLNADSVEKCSPKVLIPGRQRKPDDCRTNTFVTRALCQ